MSEWTPITGLVNKMENGYWQIEIEGPPDVMKQLRTDMDGKLKLFRPMCWTTDDDSSSMVLWEFPLGK